MYYILSIFLNLSLTNLLMNLKLISSIASQSDVKALKRIRALIYLYFRLSSTAIPDPIDLPTIMIYCSGIPNYIHK